MRYLLCVLLSCFLAAHALEVDPDGLTDEQKAKIQLEIEALKKQKKSQENEPKTVEKIKEYVELGQAIGVGLGSAAKELNVTVNEFASSPVGKIATVIIVWKFIGREAIHYLAGSLFLVVALSAWFYLLRRICIIKSVTYTPVEKCWLRKKSVEYYDTNETNHNGNTSEVNGWRAGMIVVFFLIILISQLIMWT